MINPHVSLRGLGPPALLLAFITCVVTAPTPAAQAIAKSTTSISWSASLSGPGNLTRNVTGDLRALAGFGGTATAEATPVSLSGDHPNGDVIKEAEDKAKGEMLVKTVQFSSTGLPGEVTFLSSTTEWIAFAKVEAELNTKGSAKGWMSPVCTDVINATAGNAPVTLTFVLNGSLMASAVVSWPPGFVGFVRAEARGTAQCSVIEKAVEVSAYDDSQDNKPQMDSKPIYTPDGGISFLIPAGQSKTITITVAPLADAFVDIGLAVEFTSTTATLQRGGIEIAWQTASEVDNAGFRVYRSRSKEGPFTLADDSLIPAMGSPTQGASYEFFDAGIPLTIAPPWYQLENIDLNGNSTFHDPVMVENWPGAWWWRLHQSGMPVRRS